ncbi:hypothetical protein MVEN_01334900 [Mycena venus]|uniref:DUF6699 domain-containing protein n=1 Tax=Mycena venus TaxID=2733690 RepID=A0A8H7CW79_9AGAR|nr:hypothetical protein MVEN_01334900 [Mycena venus]
MSALNEIICTEKSRARFEDALNIDAVLAILMESGDELHDGLSSLLRNICSPLNKHIVRALSAHLESQHISSPVKATILSTLSQLQLNSDILVQIPLLPILCTLVESSDQDVLQWTCSILCNIARYDTLALFHANIVSPLALVLKRWVPDTPARAVQEAMEAFSHISAQSVEGGRAIIEAGALPILAKLVQLQCFDDSRISLSILKTVYNIASYKALVAEVVRQFPGTSLVSVLSCSINDETAAGALSIISQINRTAHPDVLPRREFRQRYEPAQPRIQPIALPAQIPGVTDIKLNRVLRFGARCIDVDFGLSEERLSLSSGMLAELATFPGLPSLTLLSPMLPWAITAHASGDGGVTVRDVLQAIHRKLEISIAEEQPDTWMVQRGEDDGKKGEKWRKARVPNSGVSSTPTGLKRKLVGHKRLDLLEGRTVFAGLSESTMGPEVWTVMFV